MATDTKAGVTTQVYEVYIRATPESIWDAITSPEWTTKYAYRGAAEYDLRPGGAYKARWAEGVHDTLALVIAP